ncbi:Copia protein [Symbiodinium microadriaticum]|uniref:Copia protein n=1 Tax=Symbiodinium microadriaticum TaxID=2951 RepID=A0A1Q9DMJ9_SYMMI|nr:Copia protein [Symbiodinium microadriaticum]
MNEAGLGDLSMAGRGDEPNYADQDPIHDPQPRVARSGNKTVGESFDGQGYPVKQIFVGLSPSASVWYDSVETAAYNAYNRWLVAVGGADPPGGTKGKGKGTLKDLDGMYRGMRLSPGGECLDISDFKADQDSLEPRSDAETELEGFSDDEGGGVWIEGDDNNGLRNLGFNVDGLAPDAEALSGDWQPEVVQAHLTQSIADESLWYVFKKERSGEECHALLVVYVDDILGLGPDVILVELFRAIRRIWTLSEPEWIVRDKSVRFCGIELQTLDGGFRMAQSDYLRELFARYEIVSSVSCPITAWNDPVPEEAPRPEIVKEAQALTGALLWAASKTRPDISFSVSKLGQFAVKAPDTVVKAGYQVLKYLFGTVELGIEYRRPVGTEWADAPVPRTLETIELFTDASHAPEGGKSNQAIFILWNNMLVAWEASKQPFTTLSSAEAELVVVMAGIVAAESIGAIFEELLSRDIIISALCDNQASALAGLALMSAIRGANAQPSNDGYVLEFEGVLGWLIGARE